MYDRVFSQLLKLENCSCNTIFHLVYIHHVGDPTAANRLKWGVVCSPNTIWRLGRCVHWAEYMQIAYIMQVWKLPTFEGITVFDINNLWCAAIDFMPTVSVPEQNSGNWKQLCGVASHVMHLFQFEHLYRCSRINRFLRTPEGLVCVCISRQTSNR